MTTPTPYSETSSSPSKKLKRDDLALPDYTSISMSIHSILASTSSSPDSSPHDHIHPLTISTSSSSSSCSSLPSPIFEFICTDLMQYHLLPMLTDKLAIRLLRTNKQSFQLLPKYHVRKRMNLFDLPRHFETGRSKRPVPILTNILVELDFENDYSYLEKKIKDSDVDSFLGYRIQSSNLQQVRLELQLYDTYEAEFNSVLHLLPDALKRLEIHSDGTGFSPPLHLPAQLQEYYEFSCGIESGEVRYPDALQVLELDCEQLILITTEPRMLSPNLKKFKASRIEFSKPSEAHFPATLEDLSVYSIHFHKNFGAFSDLFRTMLPSSLKRLEVEETALNVNDWSWCPPSLKCLVLPYGCDDPVSIPESIEELAIVSLPQCGCDWSSSLRKLTFEACDDGMLKEGMLPPNLEELYIKHINVRRAKSEDIRVRIESASVFPSSLKVLQLPNTPFDVKFLPPNLTTLLLPSKSLLSKDIHNYPSSLKRIIILKPYEIIYPPFLTN